MALLGMGLVKKWALTLGVVASKTFQEFKRAGIWSTAHQPVAERPWWVKSSCCSAFFACGNGRFLCCPMTLGLTGQSNLSSQQHELKTFVPLAWHSLNVFQSFSMSMYEWVSRWRSGISRSDVPTEVSVVSEKAAFLQSLCKSTGISNGFQSL